MQPLFFFGTSPLSAMDQRYRIPRRLPSTPHDAQPHDPEQDPDDFDSFFGSAGFFASVSFFAPCL